jgi:hypothetical protein
VRLRKSFAVVLASQPIPCLVCVCDSAAIAVTELDGSSGEQVLMKRHHNLRTSSISTSENDKKFM